MISITTASSISYLKEAVRRITPSRSPSRYSKATVTARSRRRSIGRTPSAGPLITTEYRAADFNHDGNLDLVIAGYNVAVYLGNGNATFQAPTDYHPGVGANQVIVDLVDIDGDGNIDIPFADDSAFTVLLGSNDGSFSQTKIFAEGVLGIRAVRAGDVDGDGKIDVVVFHDPDSQELSMVSVLINNSLPELLNISTRMQVLTGDNVLIGGFIITGIDPKKVIVRGLGPSLGSAGLSGVLADPNLELHEPDGTVVTNDNWKDSQEAEITATGIPPTDDLESAIVETLAPGAYTAIVSGKDGGTGVGLVEAYDLDQAADSQLANISTRGFVDTGDNVMIGGLILGAGAGASSTVIVRGIGPSLTAAGVAGALADPMLELHDSNGAIIASNDDWMDSPDKQTIIDDGLAPTNVKESAVLVTAAAGAYTAILSGVGNMTGVGLVEAYNLK